ncbi:hypothetical protein J8273_0900 [Carpediemonas membranifera]|uniref:Uncharacterized protein n=1 Tax=Carpediemonas membranifera TaxID=201153 RepID=A0A8J6B397_9EUKA|nr:hypothetical protein J8273_0900 [Carpediemonas membranifera]|eukprot:KAG9397410.1 hypothetical protein J8273_0900 [Carpediemonas membranifera]
MLLLERRLSPHSVFQSPSPPRSPGTSPHCSKRPSPGTSTSRCRPSTTQRPQLHRPAPNRSIPSPPCSPRPPSRASRASPPRSRPLDPHQRPPLSMNVELAAGQELPAALHTLNQGAYLTKMYDKIYKALTPEAKCLWFLCRKFFFTWNVAEKDGESCQWNAFGRCYHHRMYMGRLFMLCIDDYDTSFTRARMPRALEVYIEWSTYIDRTPKGLCPKVAELEASQPPWEKHMMVTDVSMKGYRTFILTPVGTVMAGFNAQRYVGPVDRAIRNHFHPVAVPPGFVPDHIMQGSRVAILSMGDRQMISGSNWDGRLGLGHENWVTGFVDLPFRVDRVMSEWFFNIFLSGRQPLFAGMVLKHIVQSGLLPGYLYMEEGRLKGAVTHPNRGIVDLALTLGKGGCDVKHEPVEPAAQSSSLFAVYDLAMHTTREVSGDIPSLIASAAQFHSNYDPSSEYHQVSSSKRPYPECPAHLLSMLSKLPPLQPNAQACIDKAISILSQGPHLSMNIELAEGEALPDHLYTLLQGTLWAILMQAGADPDMYDTERKLYSANTKSLWFICRKFFFTHQVSELDGAKTDHYSIYFHRLYAGRLFARDILHGHHSYGSYTHLRTPPVISAHSTADATCSMLILTPRGLYGWSTSAQCELGFEKYTPLVPTRIRFPACPAITALDNTLPPWKKHRLIRQVSLNYYHAFVLTPVGLAVCGFKSHFFVSESTPTIFHPVLGDIVPEYIISGAGATVVSVSGHQLVAGDNSYGQLGLGHSTSRRMSGFVPVLFEVNAILHSVCSLEFFNVFLSGHQALFAGRVPKFLSVSGLLPGFSQYSCCETARPLCFPARVSRIYVDTFEVIWVSESLTHCYDFRGHYTVLLEAIEVGSYCSEPCFMDERGAWFRMSGMCGRVAQVRPFGTSPPPAAWGDSSGWYRSCERVSRRHVGFTAGAPGAMSSADSTHVAAREALISAFRLSVAITASIPGDIPTLLKEAFSRHFDEQMPAIHDAETTTTPTSAESLYSLTAMLSEIPPLEPAAQVLLDRARSIITSGPPLSMNVELAEGQELPAALHTLNQGAYLTKMYDKIYKALTPEAKCLWFLCRKFFFTWNVAEKDGECNQYYWRERFYHHRMYMGRLFMLCIDDYDTSFTRARMPRALEVYIEWSTYIDRTPKGLWGWGHNDVAQLGFKTSGFVDPTRLTFPAARRSPSSRPASPPGRST